MASNSIEFSINIDGTAYQGIAKISEAMNDLNVKVNKTQGAFKTLGDAAFRVNAIADFIGKATSAFSGIAKAGMDNEMLLMNMRTLYQGNAEAAQDMYDRISEYGKQTVYDKSGLVEAQKTMMSFGIEGEKIQLDLDCATIKVKGTKNVVKTQLSERKGSVKEVFAVDDYTIDIKGVLIGHDGVLPCSQVQWLRDMYESKKSIDLHNALTAYFLQEQKNVVITALNFYDQEAKDERHIPFSMTLISDYVETLEFI